VSRLLVGRISPHEFGLITITKVKTSPDLSWARFYVQCSKTNKEKLLQCLRGEAHFLQQELNAHLKLRRIPKVQFVPDETFEYVNRIEELLKGKAEP
jgi:ribosome-binding factor A